MRITFILDIMTLTTLLIVSANASLENAGSFQLESFHSLVNRFNDDLNKSITNAPSSSLAVRFAQKNPAPARPSDLISEDIGTFSVYGLNKANTLSLNASAIVRSRAFKKYLYAFPAPNQLNITGLSGSVSLNNTGGHLAQALFTVWANPDGCPESGAVFDTYDQIIRKYPKANILFRYVLKSSQPGIVSVPTEFTLPVELPVSGWIFTVLDGGEPAHYRQVTLNSSMTLHYNARSDPANPPRVVPLEYEYCYGQKWGCQLHSTRASGRDAFAYVQPITFYTYLWNLVGDVSAASFTGWPYTIPPVGPWVANFDFYVYPDCSGMKSGPQGPANYYSKIPASAIKIAEVQLNGSGKVALQQHLAKQFSPILLKPGNCLVCLTKFTAACGGATLESQAQVLLQNIESTITVGALEHLSEAYADEQYKKLLKEKDQYLT